MKYVAPVAKASGQSLEEMSAITGILGNAGIQASQAGTSLRMMLIRLAKPPKMARKALEGLNLSVSDAQGNMKPLSQIVGELKDKTEGMTQAQKLSTVAAITGTEAASAMLAMMDAGPDKINEFTKALENSGGVAEEIASKQLDNLMGQLTILKSGLEAAAIAIGTALLPAVKFLTSVVQSLVNWFNGLNSGTKTTIAIVAALTAGFGLLMGPILILVAMIPSIVAGFTAIAAAVGVASSTLLIIIGVVAAVVVALVAIGIGLYKAYQKVDWFRNAVDTAWAWIKNAWSTAVEFVKEVSQRVIAAVSAFIGEKLAEIRAFWDKNGDQIMKIVNKFMTFVGNVIEIGMDVIQDIFQTVWPIIEDVVGVAWEGIKFVVNTVMDVIMGLIETGLAIIEGDWGKAWESIKKIGEDIWHNIEEFFGNIDLWQIGVDIIQGLIDGIGSMFGGIKKMVSEAAALVPDWLAKKLGIRSPSRVTMALGEYTGEGLAVGMANSLGMISKAASGMAGAAVPSIGGVGTTSAIRRGSTSSSSTTNYNTPVTVNLTYNGSGGSSDAYGMIDIIERELGKRTDTKMRIKGAKR